MNDRQSFIAAIKRNTHDNTVRLVYADWLEEHDEPDRAQFIRMQLKQEAMHEARNKLKGAEREMFQEQVNVVNKEVNSLRHRVICKFKGICHLHSVCFARGFVRTMHVYADEWMKGGARLLELEWIPTVVIRGYPDIEEHLNPDMSIDWRLKGGRAWVRTGKRSVSSHAYNAQSLVEQLLTHDYPDVQIVLWVNVSDRPNITPYFMPRS